MTKTPLDDVGASVRARLSRLARERGEDFQFVLTRYACPRSGRSRRRYLAETIEAVRAFVELPLIAAANATPAPGTWRAG
jgi:hypothetical protein